MQELLRADSGTCHAMGRCVDFRRMIEDLRTRRSAEGALHSLRYPAELSLLVGVDDGLEDLALQQREVSA